MRLKLQNDEDDKSYAGDLRMVECALHSQIPLLSLKPSVEIEELIEDEAEEATPEQEAEEANLEEEQAYYVEVMEGEEAAEAEQYEDMEVAE
jgi:hypothetical protein